MANTCRLDDDAAEFQPVHARHADVLPAVPGAVAAQRAFRPGADLRDRLREQYVDAAGIEQHAKGPFAVQHDLEEEMSVVDLRSGTSTDARPAGNTKSGFGAPGCANCTPVSG